MHLHNRTEKYTHKDKPEYTGWALIKLPRQKPPTKSSFQKEIPCHQTHAELEKRQEKILRKFMSHLLQCPAWPVQEKLLKTLPKTFEINTWD